MTAAFTDMAKQPTARAEIDSWIQIILQQGAFDDDGQRAIKRLASVPGPAVDAMIEALQRGPESSRHPMDQVDAVTCFFCAMAPKVPDKLIHLLDQAFDPVMIYSALAHSRSRRSSAALIAGLKHENPYARWAAAESLVKHRSKRAVSALLNALADRSHMVKWSVMNAMLTNRMYRKPEAVPMLQRIVSNKAVRRHSPHMGESAARLIEQIERGR